MSSLSDMLFVVCRFDVLGLRVEFMKEAGCNKIKCPRCGTLSCYVCRKAIQDGFFILPLLGVAVLRL